MISLDECVLLTGVICPERKKGAMSDIIKKLNFIAYNYYGSGLILLLTALYLLTLHSCSFL
jgi:hypothetical protein